jgi:Beta-propeller repeat
MKFDANGVQQWVKQVGTESFDGAHGVTVDATGNVYITGDTLGAFPGNSNAGDQDIFLIKFDANGVSR